MSTLFYIISVDILVILLMIPVIFGSYAIFGKSVADHFFPDDLLPNKLEKFAKENDSLHRINLFYALLMFLGVVTFVLYEFVLK